MSIILHATEARHIAAAKMLMIEYAKALNVDLAFQDFEGELASFPIPYAPPGGTLLVALEQDHVVGIVAVKRLDDEICEMKRLYVSPGQRGRKLGRWLAAAAIAQGKHLGYKSMRLDTFARMTEAGPLYQSLGFEKIPAYYQNPEADTIYMEKRL